MWATQTQFISSDVEHALAERLKLGLQYVARTCAITRQDLFVTVATWSR